MYSDAKTKIGTVVISMKPVFSTHQDKGKRPNATHDHTFSIFVKPYENKLLQTLAQIQIQVGDFMESPSMISSGPQFSHLFTSL